MMKKIPFRFNRNKEKKAEQEAKALAQAAASGAKPGSSRPKGQTVSGSDRRYEVLYRNLRTPASRNRSSPSRFPKSNAVTNLTK